MSDESIAGEGVPKKKENEHSDGSDTKNQSPTTPPTVTLGEPNHSPANRHDCCKKYKRVKEEIKWWFEVLGIAGGLIGIGFLIRQDHQMKIATDAAVSQSKILKGQLDEMQKARNLDERAWIGITQTVLENSKIALTNNDFRVEFKNTGRTPATDVAMWMDAGSFVPRLWNITNNSTNWIRYSGMLAPDATGSINTSSEPIDDNELSAIQNKGFPYYVYGKIWYRDIFHNTHWTEFCFQIVWNPNLGALPVTPHNTCDDAQTNEPNQ